jgi:hypothetical protein
MELKFDDYSAREVAQLLGVTKQCVEIWCRTRGWGPTHPWRIPRELLECIRAEREAAVRASL